MIQTCEVKARIKMSLTAGRIHAELKARAL
jgi:hypothetical protein